jgi:hypothetical protein
MMGGVESGPWSSEMVLLRSKEIWLVCQDGDLEFLGRDSLCACALQKGVCVLEVGEFIAEREGSGECGSECGCRCLIFAG